MISPEAMGTPVYFEEFCKRNFPKKEGEPLVIIEVGTWKGASAFRMISACEKNCKVYCVDTWLGSTEHYDNIERGTNGYPRIYEDFWKNVKDAEYEDIITPITLPSTDAAKLLARKGVKADVIYIDAAHDYKNTKADLDAYWPLLKDDGLFFGDDYSSTWFGVVGAVNQFSHEVGIPANITASTWWLNKLKN